MGCMSSGLSTRNTLDAGSLAANSAAPSNSQPISFCPRKALSLELLDTGGGSIETPKPVILPDESAAALAQAINQLHQNQDGNCILDLPQSVVEDILSELDEERIAQLEQQCKILSVFEPPPGRSAIECLLGSPSIRHDFASVDSDAYIPHYKVIRDKRKADKRNRVVRIFFSSTFRDMMEERELLIKKVIPELQSIYSPRGVFLSEVDLRWGITTEQSSEVDNCRPWFVCMLGERYGWHQPPGTPDLLLQKTFGRASLDFPWVAKHPQASITELEIRHAYLNDPQQSDHALFYFRNPTYSTSRGDNFLSESDHAKSRLSQLKGLIRKEGTVSEYSNPGEVAEMVKQNLRTLLDRDFPVSEVPSTLEMEHDAHDAFCSARTRLYVDGECLIQNLTLATDNSFANASAHPIPIIITGAAGCGKSALLANFAFHYEQTHSNQVTISHFVGCSPTSTDLQSLLHRLVSEISLLFNVKKKIPTDKHALIEEFPHWLVEASRSTALLVIIDGIDQISDVNAQELAWLPMQIPPQVQFVLSSREGRCTEVAKSRNWQILPVPPLSRTDIAVLSRELLGHYGKTLADSQLALLQDSEPCKLPLYLRTILEELHFFGVFEQVTTRIKLYLSSDTVPDLIQHVFTRLEEDLGENKPALEKTLSSIFLSEKGLYEQEILDICHLSRVVWSSIFVSIKDMFFSNFGVISFSHDYIRVAVEKRYMHTPSKVQEVRHLLLNYYSNCPNSPRKSQELSYQYFKSGDTNALANFLTLPDVFLDLCSPQTRFLLYVYWRQCEKVVPVDQLLIKNVTLSARTEEKKSLCNKYLKAGKFFEDIGNYSLGSSSYDAAFQIGCTLPEKDIFAETCDCMGYLLRLTGKYQSALPFYQDSLKTRENLSGESSLPVASTLNDMGVVYRKMGKYQEAEPLYLRALTIREKILGGSHPDVADSYNSLGALYQDLNNNPLSEEYFRKALRIRESALGPNHPDVAMTLSNFASLLIDESRYDDAEILLGRAFDIYERLFGEIHPDVARVLNTLAGNFMEKGFFDKAEELYKQSISIREQLLGPTHPDLALSLNDYAVLFARQGKRPSAEPLYERALSIRLQAFGKNHPDTAQSMNNLAELKADLGDTASAQKMLQESLGILTGLFGENHCNVAQTLNLLANIAQRQNAPYDEIMPLYTRALSILEKTQGYDHPDVALTLNDAAVLNLRAGFLDQAEQFYIEALAVTRDVFKNEAHRDVVRQKQALMQFYTTCIEQESPDSPKALTLASKLKKVQSLE
ncbi:tetratricopeptide repeat protein [Pelomyxa schiedti]|nr:tetratricopeptide repeat protein [Pelomyxa schiedti]